MLFYFVRHGETEANRHHLLAGSGIDYELNAQGHVQAEQLALSIFRARANHPIHRVVVSDMKRARQTAKYMAQSLNLNLEVVPDLREWHLGEWEGKPFAEFGHLLLGDGEPKEGESRQKFYRRIEVAWQGIHSASRPYAMVSHGAVWLAMQDLLQIPRFKLENCQMVKVQSVDGRWQAEVVDFSIGA